MKYFKVVDNINSQVTIDTNKTNYSLTLVKKDRYIGLLDFISQSSNDLDLPLDFYFSLNNNIALWGNTYLQNLPKSIDHVFELFALTSNSNHKNIYINEDNLVDILENLGKFGFEVFQEGFYLWEYIYERVRVNSYKDKPSRGNSFFLFDSLKDCEYYIDKHKGSGQICEVEILDTHSLFKADMNLLDIIPNNFTFRQTEILVADYWLGKSTDNAIFEYLFQGSCNLKPITL